MSARPKFLPLALLPAALLAGCASTRLSECTRIAGAGWSPLSKPPPNATQLLQMSSVPAENGLVWLAKGDHNLLVCDYTNGLIIPGCSGSTAYSFEQRDGRWVSSGQLLDACNSDIETK